MFERMLQEKRLLQEKIASLEKKWVLFARNKPEWDKLKVEKDRMAIFPWKKK